MLYSTIASPRVDPMVDDRCVFSVKPPPATKEGCNFSKLKTISDLRIYAHGAANRFAVKKIKLDYHVIASPFLVGDELKTVS